MTKQPAGPHAFVPRVWVLPVLFISSCVSSPRMGGKDAADDVARDAAPADKTLSFQFPEVRISDVLRFICGNGILEPGEECDDKNRLPEDGCSANCTAVEPGWQCLTPGSACIAICGDGVLKGDEACDDGNTLSGDGCSPDCQAIEVGWRCRRKTQCRPMCGDGRLVGTEACDDGDTADGDGCSAACLTEPGWSCSGGACWPISPVDGGLDSDDGILRCGDGIVSGAEECDLGTENDDAKYDGCTTRCLWGRFCGDGVVNGDDNSEACDWGEDNQDGYGKQGCTSDCQPRGYCGDDRVQPFIEECDMGSLNGVAGDSSMYCDDDCYLRYYI